ncbi:MAG: Lipase precursor [Candidatus Accumulibacter sp. BA-94]|nr:MAG: Lipase precursor [Candidatus Accumulibacter sp. BA-94]
MRLTKLPRFLLLLLLLASPFARADNHYPLVLVHGFMGWGRQELLGFKYWGGLEDLQEALNQAGYPAHTGVVGPFASNWDRACELYAYIKGGAVDYGQAHAAMYGHKRYGRTFTGLYPDWGAADGGGPMRKIHLIGHSQGGQTVRVLTALLEQGAAAEQARGGGTSRYASIGAIAAVSGGQILGSQRHYPRFAARRGQHRRRH